MSNRELLLLGIVLITVGIGIAADFSLIGFGMAADVPFVFGEGSSSIVGYTPAQIEQTSIASPDLVGVPQVSTPPDNATLDFPVVGGGRTSQGTTEKKVSDLRKLFDSRVEPDKVHDTAVDITSNYPGDYTVDQVSAIFSHLVEKWHYIGDPRGVNDFFYANETLKRGEKANCVGVGDCGDFAVLMSALVESIGGTTRIVLASNNTTGGHAYAEVYVGQDNAPNSQVDAVINWLRQDFETDKIFVNINTSTKEVWLNLDWWPDQAGNPHPGGPFFAGDKNIVLYIRENYKKVPLNLPEKANKPPKLISLTSDKTSSQDAGMPITWTAKAKDPDNDQIFYKFLLNDNHVTNWTKNNTWVWNTTNDDVGENQIEVQVRDGKYGHALPNEFDDQKVDSFNITEPKPKPTIPENQPPFIVSLVSDKFSPQDAGTIITWTAKASDPENDLLVYRFLLRGRTVSDWSSANSWTWTTTSDDIGENQIEVQVRDEKHAGPDGFDSSKIVSFAITESKPVVPENQPPVINSLVPDKTNPQEAGTIITWTAKASDPENDLLVYRFLLRGRTVSDWSSANSWTWTTTSDDIGENQIEVQVRDEKHSDPDGFDNNKATSFTVTQSKPKSRAIDLTKAVLIPHAQFDDEKWAAEGSGRIGRP